MERKLKEVKENLEQKETELNQLEIVISEQVEEINVLRDNILSNQIAENITMEKKIKVQNAVIKDLSDKLYIETNKEIHEVKEERDKLLQEVDYLEKENKEKLKML